MDKHRISLFILYELQGLLWSVITVKYTLEKKREQVIFLEKLLFYQEKRGNTAWFHLSSWFAHSLK